MSRQNDENRLQARMELEHAVADYYKACQAADYEFPSDLIDVIYDATEGAVKLTEE